MSTISNVIIVHGCPSNKEATSNPATRTHDKHRQPRLEQQLQEREIPVFRPLMPTPWNRIYANFKAEFDKYDIYINEQSILVGHSCGAAFLVRWLGEKNKNIKKLILVAPRKIFDGSKVQKQDDEDLYEYDINPEIRERIEEIIMFTSDNEAPAGKKSLNIFHEALGGKIIELPNHGHYTLEGMGTEVFPELLEEIVS